MSLKNFKGGLFFLILINIFAQQIFAQGLKNIPVALGMGVATYTQEHTLDNYFINIAPEFVGYAYFPLAQNFWWRAGFRMNYSWLQPEMPETLRIEANDLRTMVECGVLFDWNVIPSVSMALGYKQTQIRLKYSEPISVVEDHISGVENHLFFHTQFGVGFPILKGLIVIEPYTRYTFEKWQSSDRFRWEQMWGYGLEATYALF
jgi:hypothetical protein